MDFLRDTIFRYTKNAWGQEALEGISFDLVYVFIGLGASFICVHLVYKFLSDRRR